MSEMAQTADHLLVIGRGRIITSAPIADVIATATTLTVRVVTPRPRQLTDALTGHGATVSSRAPGELEVSDMPSAKIGELAAQLQLPLHELTPVRASLEDAYLSLTHDQVEYRSETRTEGAQS